MADNRHKHKQLVEPDFSRNTSRLLSAVVLFLAVCALSVYCIGGALHTRTAFYSIAGPVAFISFCSVLVWRRLAPRQFLPQAMVTAVVMSVLAVSVMLQASLGYATVMVFQYQQMLQWLPMVYVFSAMFLGRYALRSSWINYALFVLVGLVACWRMSVTGLSSEQDRRFISALFSMLMSHPVYIIALSYVGNLNKTLLAVESAALRSQASMLAMIGHEIRTPLQAILGSTELLQLKGLKGSAEHRAIERIGASSLQLHRRLRDLTQLARLDADTPVLRNQPFLISELVQEVIDEATTALPQDTYEVIQRVEVSSPVLGDSAALHQVLSNLLTNALKYGGSAGPIVVRVARSTSQASEICFEIEDSGPGVDPQLVEVIFQPFFKGAGFDSGGGKGSGLGLAVVRRLVDLMGGVVRVRAANPHGAIFSVTLSLPEAPRAPP